MNGFPTTNRRVKNRCRESEFPPTEEERIASKTRSYLYLFLFLLLKQQKPGRLCFQKSPFGCMLFNNFNIYCLKNV